ncbi:MAG: hypothetical protein KAT54_05280 [Candidatus Marinimicrobia bacterium]|nr:hypothetical protein [Candidatus Neomarinimicrobiota bacterium]
MNIQKEIQQLKNKLVSNIRSYANSGNSTKIVFYSKILENLHNIESRLEGILNDFIETRNNFEDMSTVEHKIIGAPIDMKTNFEKNLTARQKGELARNAFVGMANKKGYSIQKYRGICYKGINNTLIGIAYASERQKRHWFLGLPKEEYDCIVLLCKHDKNIARFIFDKHFVIKHFNNLSEDNKGQVKFNVVTDDYYHSFLTIPNEGRVNITDYIDKFDNIPVI